MTDSGETMVAFLGVAADPTLLSEDLDGLPEAQLRPVSVVVTDTHDRLVTAGSVMTAATLIGGVVLAIYGGEQLVAGGGGALAVVLGVIGILLVGTHWGWVHVAEYVGLGLDERQERGNREREHGWLATVSPYARFTIRTTVMADASIAVERVTYKPVLTSQHTFSFDRVTEAVARFDADTPAHVIADRVETLRRDARLETDRQSELWDAASSAYDAALLDADDDQQQLAARRAAALALSQHINASLLQPPLVE
ncbi:MAG TPA: hypothetical protein VHW04_17380 [Solirubrobacteraceae bacterium]|nr:hypothetical protein [Solirubrobacteraceae bacterium]